MGRVQFCHPLLHARDWQDRPQLDEVCRWWADGGAGVCALIGIGGAGKTAIADRFLQVLPGAMPPRADLPKRPDLPAAQQLFVFSFYDAPNPDSFFTALYTFLLPLPTGGEGRGQGGVPTAGKRAENESATDRQPSYQQTLLTLQSTGPCLLVLDGLERVQDDGVRGGIFGELQDGRLNDLLVRIAEGTLPHVSVLITSRFPLARLEEGCPYYRPIDVEEIDVAAAVKLLRKRGVRGTDDQLAAIARDCGLHALTVDLTGGYIAEFGDGDATTPLQLTRFDDAEQARCAEPTNAKRRSVRLQEYRFARIAERYREGFKAGRPAALALLERICLFRLGVDARTLADIFTGDGGDKLRIAGPALASLTRERLEQTLDHLVAMKLIEPSSLNTEDGNRKTLFSIHPAVRDGFLAGLGADTRRHGHDAARSGLEAALGSAPGENPADPATLDLLEEIVYHTIQAGEVEQAFRIFEASNRIGGYYNLIVRLGASARMERLCRYFTGQRSSDAAISALESRTWSADFQLAKFNKRRQAYFLAEWGLQQTWEGELRSALRCHEFCFRVWESEPANDAARRVWMGSVRNNIAHLNLLMGRLSLAKRQADEALELTRDSATYSAFSLGLQGNIQPALDRFETALQRQRSYELMPNRMLWDLRGIHFAAILVRLGRWRLAQRVAQHNVDLTASDKLGKDSRFFQCKIAIAEIHLLLNESGKARTLNQEARDWALLCDAKEVVCLSALIQARIELSSFVMKSETQAEVPFKHEKPWLVFYPAETALDNGLKIARDCGYGILNIDLWLTRARMRLLQGDPQAALEDLRVALDDGVPANAHIGQPEFLAATHSDCCYAWGIAEGLSLRGEALLLQAAQSLGNDSFVPAKRRELTAQVSELITQAEICLTQALEYWHRLRDPEPNNANFVHPQTRTEYNYRAAETYRVLSDLAGGVLTRYPLETVVASSGETESHTMFSKYSAFAAKLLGYEPGLAVPRIDRDRIHNLGGLTDYDEQRLTAVVCRLTSGMTAELWAKLEMNERLGWMSVAIASLPKVGTMAKRFEIALSFPGEHRTFVAQVAELLSAEVGREKVLYDKYYEHEFARLGLDVYLPKLYREQSELIVLFLCPEYQKKRWCNLEWRHIRQLIASVDEGRIMLTSFGPPGDLSEIGILPGDGYLDIGTRDAAAIAALILQRLRGTPACQMASTSPASPTAPASVPHPAVAMWQKKLDFLLVEEAKAVAADMKFSIQQNIEEARAKIRELGGRP